MSTLPANHHATGQAAHSHLVTRDAGRTHVCFQLNRVSHWDAQLALESRLSTKHADATAQLLPVLLCGEESAALVFDALQARSAQSTVQAKLQSIAHDEHRHELWLRQLRNGLPPHELESAMQRALRRFFLRMADRDMANHLARIVALDAAVCTLLGALRARGQPLACNQASSDVLRRIHSDEARHVRIARDSIAQLSVGKRACDLAVEAREGLIEILQFRAMALDTLQVDPDKMFRRLRRVPRGLFA